MKRPARAWGRRLLAVAGLILTPLLLGASPGARQVYGVVWATPAVPYGPCVLSIILPASEAERCRAWTQRESGGPVFDSALGVVVVGGSDKVVRGLDAHDGHVLWERPVQGAIVSQPVLADGAVFVGTDDAMVVRVDVASGREIWSTPVDAEVTEPVVIHGDVVYVATGSDSTFALKMDSGDPIWVNKHPLPRGITLRGQARPLPLDVATPKGMATRLYVGHASGRLSILDRETGGTVDELDFSRGDAFGDLDADPIFHPGSGGRVVVASQTRGVFSIDPASHVERWRLDEPGITRLANGGLPLIIAAGAGKVLGVDAATGKSRWRFTFEKGAPTRIAVQGGRVHVASDRGALYVLDLYSGRPLQYAGTGHGIAADLDLWQDMLFYVSTTGTLVAMSNAWPGDAASQRQLDPHAARLDALRRRPIP